MPSTTELVNNYTKIYTHEVFAVVVSVLRKTVERVNQKTKQVETITIPARFSYVVYIPLLTRRTFAEDKSLPQGTSSGSFDTLKPGDRVLVRFNNGKVENAFISARLGHNDTELAKQYITGQNNTRSTLNTQEVCSPIKRSRIQIDKEEKLSESSPPIAIGKAASSVIETLQQEATVSFRQQNYYPVLPELANECIHPNSYRGLVEYYDSSGNRVAKTATNFTRATENVFIMPWFDESSGKPQAHTRLEELRKLINQENYNKNIFRVNNYGPFLEGKEYELKQLSDDDVSLYIEQLRENYILEEVDQLKLDLETIKEIEKCLQTHSKQTKKKTKTLLDKLLDEIVEKGTQEILNQLNNTLPDYLKVNIDIQKNENNEFVVKSFSVGGVKYVIGEAKDGSEDYVVVDGNQFNPLIESGLSEVNKLLPDFLQVSASDLGLSFGQIFIKKQELSDNEYKEFSIRDDIILVNNRGAMYIQMQGAKFNFGRVGDLFLDRGVTKGVSELNELLPDILQVSYRREGDVRIFDIGPFTVTATGPNKGIQVDKEKLRNTINDLPNQLFNQLPAPLQPAARMVWKETTDYLVDEVLYKKDTERKRQEEQQQQQVTQQEQQRQTISTAVDICLKSNKYDYIERPDGKIDVFLPKGSTTDQLAVTISPVPATSSPSK